MRAVPACAAACALAALAACPAPVPIGPADGGTVDTADAGCGVYGPDAGACSCGPACALDAAAGRCPNLELALSCGVEPRSDGACDAGP